MAKTTRPRGQTRSCKQSGKEPSESSKAGKTERFACPFAQRYRSMSAISKTCSHGSLDIRHVKEHIKNHHRCNKHCVRATTPADAACSNPLHTTPTQRSNIEKMQRRSIGETRSAQWMRLFGELFPDARDAPTAPCLPTSDHLRATADTMTDEFAGVFGERLSDANLLGGRSGVEAARLFACQFAVYIEVVSLGGLGPSRTFQSSGDPALATVPSLHPSGESSASGEDVDTPETLVAVEPEIQIEEVSHDTLGVWIEKYPW